MAGLCETRSVTSSARWLIIIPRVIEGDEEETVEEAL